MEFVPFEESAIDAYPSRQAWDATAAELVATMLDRWHLTAAEAFVGGEAGSVLRVTTASGEPAVLKVGFPHAEGVWEAVGLEIWAGICPAVLRQDAWTWSLLLEAVEPGTRLDRAGLSAQDALGTGAELYRRLQKHRAPAGVVSLGTIVSVYLRNVAARMPAQRSDLAALSVLDLVEAAMVDLDHLIRDSRDAFLHGDYNPGNLLLDGRGKWRVIDPKPMVGDPAFDLFPLIEQVGDPWRRAAPAEALTEALELVSLIVGCDAGRVARWCTARAALNVSWLLQDGNAAAARNAAAELKIWAAVSAA